MTAAFTQLDNLDEIDFPHEELPGVELEEDVFDPTEPEHNHIIELDEDADFILTVSKKKPNFISAIGDVLKCEVGTVDWIFPGMLREGTVAMLVGEPGCGKSTVVLKLGDAVAWARVFLGHQCEPRPVLYLDRDDNSLGDIQARMDWLQIKSGGRFKYFGSNVPEEEVPMPYDPMVVDWVNKQPQRPVIVLDSYSRFLEGGDENSSKDVNRLWDLIAPLKRSGCSFLMIHHMNKSLLTKDPFRGSTAIRAGIDYGFMVKNTSEHQLLTDIEVKRVKSRSAVPFGDKDGLLRVRIDQEDKSFEVVPAKEKKEASKDDEASAADAAEKLYSILAGNPDGVGSVQFDQLVKEAKLSRDPSRVWLRDQIKAGTVVRQKVGKTVRYSLAEFAPAENGEGDLVDGMTPAPTDD